MTLICAWSRSVGDIRELVVASDSLLSGDGARWKGCPKLFALPRGDCFLGFAGRSFMAYPMIIQAIQAIESNLAQAQRRYDIVQLANLVENLLNQIAEARLVAKETGEDPDGDKIETIFLFGGWSWREQRFFVWQYSYPSPPDHLGRTSPMFARGRVVRSEQLGEAPGEHLAFAGDVEAVKSARAHFTERRRRAGMSKSDPVDMEPLETVRDLIRSPALDTAGGPPQVLKVYRHMNVEQFGVTWRDTPGSQPTSTYLGRPLLDYEKPYYTFIDPDEPASVRQPSPLRR